MVWFHPGSVGLIVAGVEWIAMLVAATSALVELLVALCDVYFFVQSRE